MNKLINITLVSTCTVGKNIESQVFGQFLLLFMIATSKIDKPRNTKEKKLWNAFINTFLPL